jgi:hypothetical protein
MVFLSTSTQIFERHIKTGKDHVLPFVLKLNIHNHHISSNRTKQLINSSKLQHYIHTYSPPPHLSIPLELSLYGLLCLLIFILSLTFFLLFLQSFTLYLSHQYCCHSGIPDSLAMLAQQTRVLGRQPAQTMNAAWYIVRSVIVFSHFKRAS